MLREMCIIIILMKALYFDLHLCAQCIEDDNPMMKFICAIVKFRSNVQGYVDKKVWKIENKRRRAKYGLLKFFSELTDDSDNGDYNVTTIRSPAATNWPLGKSTTTSSGLWRKRLITRTGHAEELIVSQGFAPETHNVYTADGYTLTIHRMVSDRKPSGPKVLLHHGLFGSSEDWLLLNTSVTLPSLLINRGYDVWLLNARGNKYTTEPSTLYKQRYTFNDYSWHEMGIYDLPATITYINNQTSNQKLYYIGHSMGASALLVLLSTLPPYNEKVTSAIFLAPLAFMYHTKGPLKVFAEFPNATYEYISKGAFPDEIVENFCQGSLRSCLNTRLFIANGGKKVWDSKVMENILNFTPTIGSTKTVAHYMQLIKSGQFQTFDYGNKMNIKIYNTTSPPKYNLQAITVPISIFTSPSDWLSTIPDTVTLLNNLQNAKTFHVVRRDNFTHLDFLWSREATEFVFSKVLDILGPISVITNLEDRFNIEQVESTSDNLIADDYD